MQTMSEANDDNVTINLANLANMFPDVAGSDSDSSASDTESLTQEARYLVKSATAPNYVLLTH